MISQTWSWILTLTGVSGLLVASISPKCGWGIGVIVQPVWIIYGCMSDQSGFIASGILYGIAYVCLLRKELCADWRLTRYDTPELSDDEYAGINSDDREWRDLQKVGNDLSKTCCVWENTEVVKDTIGIKNDVQS